MALFLRLLAQEVFPRFREVIDENFGHKRDKGWVVRNEFQKNEVIIWEKLTDLKVVYDPLHEIQTWTLSITNRASQMIFISVLLTLIISLFMKKELVEETARCLAISIPTLVLTALLSFGHRYYTRARLHDFSQITDLLQCSIETPPHELTRAYDLFKQIPEIEVVRVED